jgi:hypothetical protein
MRNQRCPICESIEGCDHPLSERVRAFEDTAYRDRMRAEDPLWQLQQARALNPGAPK